MAGHIDSPDWIKTKKSTINCINDDHKSFQNNASVILNHQEIGEIRKECQKISLFYINITRQE